jgi:hypothetical protein
MQKHVKIYLRYFDYGEQDAIPCEACQGLAVEVHHIQGRGKGKDVISNLMALCRACHERAHGSIHPVSKEEFLLIHNYFLMGKRKQFLKR